MLTTSATTSLAFGMTMVIKIPTVRYMGLFACTMVIANFIMVCTMYLAVLILWDKYVRVLPCCGCSRAPTATPGKNAKDGEMDTKLDPATAIPDGISLSRLLDPCCANVVAPNIIRHPKKILSFFGIMSIVFLVFAFQFREPTTACLLSVSRAIEAMYLK